VSIAVHVLGNRLLGRLVFWQSLVQLLLIGWATSLAHGCAWLVAGVTGWLLGGVAGGARVDVLFSLLGGLGGLVGARTLASWWAKRASSKGASKR
jgi:uncharacterized membrane protein YedE/YeeE